MAMYTVEELKRFRALHTELWRRVAEMYGIYKAIHIHACKATALAEMELDNWITEAEKLAIEYEAHCIGCYVVGDELRCRDCPILWTRVYRDGAGIKVVPRVYELDCSWHTAYEMLREKRVKDEQEFMFLCTLISNSFID